jgi:hypothetical protein
MGARGKGRRPACRAIGVRVMEGEALGSNRHFGSVAAKVVLDSIGRWVSILLKSKNLGSEVRAVRIVLVLTVGLLAIGAPALAEVGQEKPQAVGDSFLGLSGNVPSSKLRLMDPSRLQHSNQLIFSLDNSGSDSFQGLYLSTFDYRLASPLDVSVTLGARFSPYNSIGDSSQGSFFLSNLRLRYQPSESTLIMFQYQDPRGMVPYYWNPYSYWH